MTDITPAAALPAAGWYNEPGAPGVLRYWNGTHWTEHRHARPTLTAPVVAVAPIHAYSAAAPIVVNAGGYRKAYKTSHGFHLLMSILTLGFWLPVWLVIGILNAARS